MNGKTGLNTGSIITMFLLCIASAAAGKIIYVDDDAAGANDGSSWEDAYNYLQDALADADTATEPVTIQVAQGTYKPDQGGEEIAGDRYATFQLENDVVIRGGYAGCDEIDPDARDIVMFETILSGDLNGDDGPHFANNIENSYHVITGDGISASAVLDGFTLTAGNANGDNPSWKYGGGGGMYNYSSDPTVLNCVFTGNSGHLGGGIYSREQSMPTFVNCIISGNRSTLYSSGGMKNYQAAPTIINCTFYSNTAPYTGAAMDNYYCSPKLTNCIVWDNRCDWAAMSLRSQISGGSPIVNYSCIQDEDPEDGTVYPGIANIDDDPLFVDADGADNVAGTMDENLRLLPDSPCLDGGDNSAIPPSVVTDLDREGRIANGTVDMGPYEGPDQGFLLSTELLVVPEEQTATFTVALAMDPLGTVEAEVDIESGDPDITIESGNFLTFDSSNYRQGQVVTVAAAQDADYFHGEALIFIRATGFLPAGVCVIESDSEAPIVIYVDSDAPGDNNGTSWTDAFIYLQDALAVARVVPEVEEIRIAQGVYTPDRGDGFTTGDRQASFELVNGVTLKGGYRGFSEPNPDTRDIDGYKTILSGDLNGDDIDVLPDGLLSEPTRAENSWHIVSAGRRTDETAVLDGCVVTGGNANGGGYPVYQNDGGGMYTSFDSSPTIKNCTFAGNSADWNGGGFDGNGNLINCKFLTNAAEYGGGVSRAGALTDCIFEENYASLCGGGVYDSATLNHCIFVRNSAGFWGGGISGGGNITNCTFIKNWAGKGGGGMDHMDGPNATLTNCILTGNLAGQWGGAIYTDTEACDLTLVNCTIAGNYSGYLCGGVYGCWDTELALTNCILWGNSDPYGMQESAQILQYRYGDFANPVTNYCCIQEWTGSIGGTGNIGSDPCFVEPGYWIPDGPWIQGDYHLLPDSSCIDTGDNGSVAADANDLDGNPRILDGDGDGIPVVDMGAYEYRPPISAEVKIAPRTINLQSKGKGITAFLRLPEDYNVTHIEPNSVFLENEIKSDLFWLTEDQQIAIARFSREQVQAFLEVGDIELTITGELTDGTNFEASDIIKVVDKGGGKSPN